MACDIQRNWGWSNMVASNHWKGKECFSWWQGKRVQYCVKVIGQKWWLARQKRMTLVPNGYHFEFRHYSFSQLIPKHCISLLEKWRLCTLCKSFELSVWNDISISAPRGHFKGYLEEGEFMGSIGCTLTLMQRLREHVTTLLTCPQKSNPDTVTQLTFSWPFSIALSWQEGVK